MLYVSKRRYPPNKLVSLNFQMKSRSDTMFFWDNERRIDMVLAYEDDEEDDEDEEEVNLAIVQKYLDLLHAMWFIRDAVKL